MVQIFMLSPSCPKIQINKTSNEYKNNNSSLLQTSQFLKMNRKINIKCQLNKIETCKFVTLTLTLPLLPISPLTTDQTIQLNTYG